MAKIKRIWNYPDKINGSIRVSNSNVVIAM